MLESLKDTILAFSGKRIVVVGDVMLDKATIGSVRRLSPEAPVPILEIEKESHSPGGAGNVALNIAKLGGKATLIGTLGKDHQGVILENTLHAEGINTKLLKLQINTTTKERIIASTSHIARLDTESDHQLSQEEEAWLMKAAIEAIKDAQALIISDYAKGALSKSLAQQLISEARRLGIPCIADPKPEHLSWYAHASMTILNEKEARTLHAHDSLPNVAMTIAKSNHTVAYLTRGGHSGILYDSAAHEIAVPQGHAIDPSGAGDTTTAAIALALAAGSSYTDAASIGNHAGSIVVGKAGIGSVSQSEVLTILRHDISADLRENMAVKQKTIDTQLEKIERLAILIAEAYQHKKKILIFGNGGSAADAQHFAAELVGRYKMERRGLPAIALTTDTSAITAIGNDYGYDQIFSRQVEALANPGDLVIGITTSGSSPNVLLAIDEAKRIGAYTVGLTGKDGGALKDHAQLNIIVPSSNTPRIQETHITIIHIVCELLEKKFAHAWNNDATEHP